MAGSADPHDDQRVALDMAREIAGILDLPFWRVAITTSGAPAAITYKSPTGLSE